MPSHLEWHGEEIEALILAAAAKGLASGADIVGDASQDRVPVQTGELKRSKFVDANGLSAVVGYRDSKAAAAHENLHDRAYRNGKQAKFLESAAVENRAEVARSVAEEIRRVL